MSTTERDMTSNQGRIRPIHPFGPPVGGYVCGRTMLADPSYLRLKLTMPNGLQFAYGRTVIPVFDHLSPEVQP